MRQDPFPIHHFQIKYKNSSLTAFFTSEFDTIKLRLLLNGFFDFGLFTRDFLLAEFLKTLLIVRFELND